MVGEEGSGGGERLLDKTSLGLVEPVVGTQGVTVLFSVVRYVFKFPPNIGSLPFLF